MSGGLDYFQSYADRLGTILAETDWQVIEPLAAALFDAWRNKRQVFLAGNGGSAGNANHIANDFIYPVSKQMGSGLRVRALSENPATLTCLANDEGYEHIYSAQLGALADAGDLLIVLSGSGNSPNIVRVLEEAKKRQLATYAIIAFDGGRAKAIADHPIHFAVDDMQIAEDLQMIVFNMILQYLYSRRDEIENG